MSRIRNIVFASQGGTGKSSLIASLLHRMNILSKLPRKEEIFKACDYAPEELNRGFTIISKVFTAKYKDYLLNLLDTPGYPDFSGEIIGAIQAVENAVVVVDATGSIEVQTERVWEWIKEKNLPRVVFVNKIDRDEADFKKLWHELEEKLEVEFIPLYLPYEKKLVSILEEDSPPESLKQEIEEIREKIIERAAESTDELTEKYLEEGGLSKEEIEEGIREQVRSGNINFIIPGSAWEELGVDELISVFLKIFPSPEGRKLKTVKGEEITCEENGSFVAQVFKSTFEPHLGDMSLVRIFRGKISSGATILNATRGETEKIGQIQRLSGKNRQEIESASAGEIIGLLKLKNTHTSDTLTSPDTPLLLESIDFPSPIFSIAIRPKERKDEEKISYALGKICQEDPTLKTEVSHEFGQTILSGLGELQLNMNLEKLSRYGVNVVVEEPKIPYRETIKGTAKAQGKYKRQTGGRGQYGDCWLELTPKERGEGFEFVNKIVGGAIPARFIPSVEKGVREAMGKGPLAGYPVVDVQVTCYDGSFHPVDSSDIAFQIAGSMAFKNAYPQANPTLLEPIMKVEIKIPEEYLGDITGDLNARRGKILSIDAEGRKRVVKVLVPLAELHRYAIDLKSMTQGRGTFAMEFSHYEEVPSHLQTKIIKEAKKEEKK